MRTTILILCTAAWLLSPGGSVAGDPDQYNPAQYDPDQYNPDQYNVVWKSPSADADGSMPLGNGDISVNAWVTPSGELLLYIGKTDSWGDNGRLLKVGRLRFSFDPPLPVTKSYQQTLRLSDASMIVKCGEGADTTQLHLWVDANHPTVHVAVDSVQPVETTAHIELWRREQEELAELEVSDVMLNRSKPSQREQPVFVEPDTLLEDVGNAVGWYHHNRKSVGPTVTAAVQGVAEFAREDPLLHRTFGAFVSAPQARRDGPQTLRCATPGAQRFNIVVLTKHPAQPDQWCQAIMELVQSIEATPWERRQAAHRSWWQRFWQRSWIEVSANQLQEVTSLIPSNAHPVRIGVDQQGHNQLRGVLGRLRIVNDALTDAQVRDLATKGAAAEPHELPGQLYSGTPAVGHSVPDSRDWDFSAGLTIAGWIKPEKLPIGGGRIVDKVTPGSGDGILLDTYPGNSLRLIVGQRQVTMENVLAAGKWSHVAATVDSENDRIAIFVDGKLVAEQAGPGLDDAQAVSQMYALQRYIDACAGRGAYPIKFNGSIFTVPYPGRPGDADYRRWGPGYWWQNTRLPYISMCTSGDFEMMRPLFDMYADRLMPLQKYRTQLYFDHEGAFIPECIYFWGDVFSDTYGWTPFAEREDKLQTSGWHKWEWVSGVELVWMMLDYYEHTLDDAFLKKLLRPTAHEILTFFDQHYSLGSDGKLVMHPSQALETWWDTTNPMPELAGLHAVTARLLALPVDRTSRHEREFWATLQKKLPPLPVREIEGRAALAPATRFAQKRNIENPELYAVFPFRLVAFEKKNAELGRVALEHRTDRGSSGWRQDDVFMAYLGLADEAQQNLVRRARQHDTNSRFPAFWGPNYDWVPDQDHGGILMKTLQSMLIQTDGKKIFLKPAWPRNWDVRFRVHAPYRTVLEGEIRDGAVIDLKVTPPERRINVVVVD